MKIQKPFMKIQKPRRFLQKALLLFLVCCGAFSEVCGTVLREDSFLLQGRVRNAATGMLELAVCHPIANQLFSIPLRADGSFCRKLPVVGTQDVYLYLFDAVTCLTFPGDTLFLDWDAQTRDFNLSGTNATRSRELELEKLLYERFRRPYMEVQAYYGSLQYRPDLPDSTLNRAADYAKSYVATVDSFVVARGEVPHRTYLRQRAAFDMLAVMSRMADRQLIHRLLERLLELPDAEPFFFNTPDFNPLQSPSAASFMYGNIRKYLDEATSIFGWQAGELEQHLRAAAGVIPNDTVREWYLVSHFYTQMSFARLSPLETRRVYRRLDGQIRLPFFRAEYEKIGRELAAQLVPGEEAPDFLLKDPDGRAVSLHSLRGKYVYLDFWETSCAPCIREFGHLPRLQADNAAFADSIVYLSVCMGRSEEAWRARCAEMKHAGVQLYVPSNMDPRVAAYGIKAYPSYWLIGPDGRIVSVSFPRPSQLIGHFGGEPGYLGRYIRLEEQNLAGQLAGEE